MLNVIELERKFVVTKLIYRMTLETAKRKDRKKIKIFAQSGHMPVLI